MKIIKTIVFNVNYRASSRVLNRTKSSRTTREFKLNQTVNTHMSTKIIKLDLEHK